MTDLRVYIEIDGEDLYVGRISADTADNAVFAYSSDYFISAGARHISLSLPLSDKSFSPRETGAFFEGLLPEGFSRATVASLLRADADDYIAILAKLGEECPGARHTLPGKVRVSGRSLHCQDV